MKVMWRLRETHRVGEEWQTHMGAGTTPSPEWQREEMVPRNGREICNDCHTMVGREGDRNAM